MEAKRLGLCQKSLFVVPNHLTEQWASEFLNLYGKNTFFPSTPPTTASAEKTHCR